MTVNHPFTLTRECLPLFSDELESLLRSVLLAAVESTALEAPVSLGVLDFAEEEGHPFTQLSFSGNSNKKEIITHHRCLLTNRKKEKPSEIPSYHHIAESDRSSKA